MHTPNHKLAHQFLFLYWSADIILTMASGLTAYFLRFHQLQWNHYTLAMVFTSCITPIVLSTFRLYQPWREYTWPRFFLRFTQGLFVLFAILVTTAYFLKISDSFSRYWVMLWMMLFCAYFLGFRFLLFSTLSRIRAYGLNTKRVLIFGAGELGKRMLQHNREQAEKGYEIVVFLDDHADQKSSSLEHIPIQLPPSDLSMYCETHRIDEVWITLPMRAEERIHAVLRELQHAPIPIRLMFNTLNMNLFNPSITSFVGVPAFTVRQTPIHGTNRIIKELEDRILAAIILILISPMMLILALIIKCTSKGPVFFRQKRLGWNGKEFEILKFRSMEDNAEEKTGPVRATPNDARVSGFGKFIRRTSLDELPQFINVLRGDMSIVGPRPDRREFAEDLKKNIPRFMERHYVKAGITGWAQVNGWRGNSSLEKRVEFDLYYIENWSVWFDLKIILLTIIKGFVNKNAY